MGKASETSLTEAIFCPNGHLLAASFYQDEDWIDEKETLTYLGCEVKFVSVQYIKEHFGECNCISIGGWAKNEVTPGCE